MFQAGTVYAGVPAGCFYTGTVNGWNSECSGGTLIKSSDEWAAQARDMYPGYTGSYPRLTIYHGTADETLNSQNYEETIKQWAGVFGYDTQPDEEAQNDPASPFTKQVFGDRLIGELGAGIGHGIPQFEQRDLEWFGLA